MAQQGVSAGFKSSIEGYLERRGELDPLFKDALQKKTKNIDDCCTYILNQVKEAKRTAFTDAEIFAMAVHYFDEDNIKVGNKVTNVKVVHNSDAPKPNPTPKPKKGKGGGTPPATMLSLFN